MSRQIYDTIYVFEHAEMLNTETFYKLMVDKVLTSPNKAVKTERNTKKKKVKLDGETKEITLMTPRKFHFPPPIVFTIHDRYHKHVKPLVVEKQSWHRGTELRSAKIPCLVVEFEYIPEDAHLKRWIQKNLAQLFGKV